ncbi:MAG TPA: energy-coupling factor transporter transmembrane component T [bacterium]|nr:energy-coupling factor transporter transmembrane component T [bacterium]HPN43620.1 energy-coupling factor transporter transmembrane component T [bacterium]
MNDITLGQYFPGESFIHRLDPRTKLFSVFMLMTGLLVSNRPLIIGIFLCFLLLMLLLSRIPASLIFGNLRPFVWLFILTIIVHLFWTPGRTLLELPIAGMRITTEGIELGFKYSLRLIVLIILAALLTLTTSPIELTDALEHILKPLKKLRVPTHDIVMMLTLSLRFIPALIEEAQKIKNAQLSRGASFDGHIINRIKSIIPLILPLFISAFRRADELALAMDSRCYTGGDGRTSYKILKYSGFDYGVLILCVLLTVISIFYQLI